MAPTWRARTSVPPNGFIVWPPTTTLEALQFLRAGIQQSLRPRIPRRFDRTFKGLAESTLRCVLFLMLRSWCPEDDPLGVIASIDGVIDHERAAGDNLMLAKDAARWSI